MNENDETRYEIIRILNEYTETQSEKIEFIREKVSGSTLKTLLSTTDVHDIFSEWGYIDSLSILSSKLYYYKEYIYELLDTYNSSMTSSFLGESAIDSADIDIDEVKKHDILLPIIAMYILLD